MFRCQVPPPPCRVQEVPSPRARPLWDQHGFTTVRVGAGQLFPPWEWVSGLGRLARREVPAPCRGQEQDVRCSTPVQLTAVAEIWIGGPPYRLTLRARPPLDEAVTTRAIGVGTRRLP